MAQTANALFTADESRLPARRAAGLFGPVISACAAGGALILRGPNGSGKSSLLRLMAGLSRPENGQIAWGRAEYRRGPGRASRAAAFHRPCRRDEAGAVGRTKPWLSGPACAAARRRSTPRSPISASTGWPSCRAGFFRRASASGWRWRGCSRARPNCGCSTSRPPGSTPPPSPICCTRSRRIAPAAAGSCSRATAPLALDNAATLALDDFTPRGRALAA